MSQTTEIKPRMITDEELGAFIKIYREMRQWSQETLSALSGLSTRTIQRTERGEPSAPDTRRALARAFEFEDIDLFNKPMLIPSDDDLAAERKRIEEECLTINAAMLSSGKALAQYAETATMDMTSERDELSGEAAETFAQLTDYMRDYRDVASDYSAVAKLDIHAELQEIIDQLANLGVTVVVATRKVRIVGRNWEDEAPWKCNLLYMVACKKGNEPSTLIVPKKVNFRF
jgi:transcriptional regulator with XRE-family HTH domain